MNVNLAFRQCPGSGVDLWRRASYHSIMNKNDNRPRLFPIQIRTTYADLLERLEDLTTRNAMAGLAACTLITQKVKGSESLSAQGHLSDGSHREVYL